MNHSKRRPRGISFEVYDPWDGQMIVRHTYLEPWNAEKAAQGLYSRQVREDAALVRQLGRPGRPRRKSLGLRTPKTRTTLIW